MRERSIDEIAEDLADLKADMHKLVRVDLHAEQLGRLRDDIASARGDVSSLRHLTMWTLGILCSQIIAAIVGIVVAVARAA